MKLCKRAAGLHNRSGWKLQRSLWERSDRSPVGSGSLEASQRVKAESGQHVAGCQTASSTEALASLTSLVIPLTFSTLPLLSPAVHSLSTCITLFVERHRLMRSSHLVTGRCRMGLAVPSAAHTCAMWRRYASSGGQKFTGDKWRLTASHLYATHCMLLLSFNTCACIHATDACRKLHPRAMIIWVYLHYGVIIFTTSSLLTDAHVHMQEV